MKGGSIKSNYTRQLVSILFTSKYLAYFDVYNPKRGKGVNQMIPGAFVDIAWEININVCMDEQTG